VTNNGGIGTRRKQEKFVPYLPLLIVQSWPGSQQCCTKRWNGKE